MITGLIVACAPLMALMGYMAYDIVRTIRRTRAMREQLKRLGVRA